MRTYSIPTAVVLVLAFAFSSRAAEKPRPAKAPQAQPRKVWTNEDLDQLRSRGLISIVGQEAPASAQAPTASAEETFPAYASRLDDPQWYSDKAADLQAELDKRQAALQTQETAIAQAVDQRITEPGLSLVKENAGVTPAAGVANLQAAVQEVQNQLDELSDLARQHNIAPGALRG